jgi:hypothetical protein
MLGLDGICKRRDQKLFMMQHLYKAVSLPEIHFIDERIASSCLENVNEVDEQSFPHP